MKTHLTPFIRFLNPSNRIVLSISTQKLLHSMCKWSLISVFRSQLVFTVSPTDLDSLLGGTVRIVWVSSVSSNRLPAFTHSYPVFHLLLLLRDSIRQSGSRELETEEREQRKVKFRSATHSVRRSADPRSSLDWDRTETDRQIDRQDGSMKYYAAATFWKVCPHL